MAAVPALFMSGCSGSKSRLKLGEAADGEVVEAEGLSAVTPDLIATKRAALSDAYKNAVEKVVGVFISARTMVDKAVTIQQNIFGKTDGYIKKHEVLREGKEADGLYHTHIRALVSYQQVKQDLEALHVMDLQAVGNPRVAILLDETIEGEDGQNTACSDALAQGLLERGYKVVDRSELAAIRVVEATQQLLEGNPKDALKPIMQKLKAEVVVTGKARASRLTGQNLGGLISYRGSLTGKALKAKTGEILAAVNVQGSGLDATHDAAGSKALTALGNSAAEEFAGRIATELARRSSVLVTVRNVPSINVLSDIKDILARTAGVGEVAMRSFDSGTAELEVKINSATSADLAKRLSGASAFKASVTAQTQDSLEAEIQ
ncbi:MAG: hypothetical protein A2901_09490 [Elusimicrobia bacterium RIFCSPLOWO2_01_FULL_54_10]|nr:MAG: hypothetical protein A2901_09490 [Elusimicrobia bacterium RIFCSPLOWO2_01_FULL_54_10]